MLAREEQFYITAFFSRGFGKGFQQGNLCERSLSVTIPFLDMSDKFQAKGANQASHEA